MGLCDVFPTNPVCIGAKVGAAVAPVIEFATDPLGYIAQKMQQAAEGLAGTVLPQLEKLTHPNLTLDWFLSAYRVSFALAFLVWVAFLGWNFVQLARRRISGDEVAETLGLYTPMFLGGAMFGPLLGTMLLSLTGAITDALIDWGVSGTVQGTTQALQDAIKQGAPAEMAGGAIVAIIVFCCLIVALLLAFGVLLVMLVTLYLTGTIIPLSLVWLTHPRQRSKGLKVVMVWVGVCFSHVLLFLLLGVAFRMVGGLSTSFDEPGLTILANLAVAVIALLMATLSPFGLLAFAPVGPSAAAGGGPSLSLPGRSSGAGYPVSDADSQTAQLARSNDSYAGTDAGEPGDGDTGGGSPGGRPGGLVGRLAAGRDGGQSSSSMEPADSGRARPEAGDDGGADVSAAATAGTSAGNGAAAMSAASHAAADTGDTLTAAGTAAEATGVGVPVGAAMQAAGVGIKAAGGVLVAAAELAESAGEMAAEQMEHGETHTNGGTGADTRPRW
jgi:type IV secretion system protein TrbL